MHFGTWTKGFTEIKSVRNYYFFKKDSLNLQLSELLLFQFNPAISVFLPTVRRLSIWHLFIAICFGFL